MTTGWTRATVRFRAFWNRSRGTGWRGRCRRPRPRWWTTRSRTTPLRAVREARRTRRGLCGAASTCTLRRWPSRDRAAAASAVCPWDTAAGTYRTGQRAGGRGAVPGDRRGRSLRRRLRRPTRSRRTPRRRRPGPSGIRWRSSAADDRGSGHCSDDVRHAGTIGYGGITGGGLANG